MRNLDGHSVLTKLKYTITEYRLDFVCPSPIALYTMCHLAHALLWTLLVEVGTPESGCPELLENHKNALICYKSKPLRE